MHTITSGEVLGVISDQWCCQNCSKSYSFGVINDYITHHHHHHRRCILRDVCYSYLLLFRFYVIHNDQMLIKYIKDITIRVTYGFKNNIIISILGQAKNCLFIHLELGQRSPVGNR